MKLATYKDGTRDGTLMLVSQDLTITCSAEGIAATMQYAMDNWAAVVQPLQARYEQLNSRLTPAQSFSPGRCESPLPRAYQWADASAYVNHVELVRRARDAQMPESFWTDPLMYQGGSDDFIGPCDDVVLPSDEWGVDFEAEIAVITDDVPMFCQTSDAASRIRLLMLVNDVSLRGLIPGELAKGFGFFQSKPASSFSPVAVTPDELGQAWQDNKVHLPLRSTYNGQLFGEPNAGEDMTFDFATLIAHAAKSRNLGAGTIIGSGTVSNKQGTSHGSAITEGGLGYSCLAEVRMIETIRDGKPKTPFMQFGDRIHIEMLDKEGNSVFGAIDQQLKPLKG